MDLLTLLLLTVLVVIIAFIAEREIYRRTKKQNMQQLDPVTRQVIERTSRLWGTVRETSDELLTPEHVKIVPEFRQWVLDTLDERNHTRRWLLSLSDEGFQALVHQLMQFCYELNIDLAWLVRNELDTQPEIKAVVHDIVITYCTSCLKAMRIQTDIIEFRDYQAILSGLSKREQRAVGKRLLNELQDAGLVMMGTPDLVWASDEQRHQFVLQSIEYAAQKDSETFDRIWKNVMSDSQYTA